MLIAALGYLYVIGILAVAYMANGKVALGVLILLFGGLFPVGMMAWFYSRQRRGKLERLREKAEREAALAADRDIEATGSTERTDA
ncbi:MAG: hypothetical protein JO142_07400 [Burkholderiales bacterium]|nr:hypothetical protein [Burkholderiales bacterium]